MWKKGVCCSQSGYWITPRGRPLLIGFHTGCGRHGWNGRHGYSFGGKTTPECVLEPGYLFPTLLQMNKDTIRFHIHKQYSN